MPVVADTNVVVSALLYGGIPGKILDMSHTRVIVLCFNPEMLDEVHGVLMRPKFDERRAALPFPIEDVLNETYRDGLLITPEHIQPVIKRDSSDDMFLACASTANAQYIISGDKHLLDLKNVAGIPVVTPRQFLRRFK